jgi:putative AlgH/UPF0301 family transcriptional regulator
MCRVEEGFFGNTVVYYLHEYGGTVWLIVNEVLEYYMAVIKNFQSHD